MTRFYNRHGIDRRLREEERCYYRWTAKDEIGLIKRGEIRASRNHRAGACREEAGLSVATGPWLYYRPCTNGYFLHGEKIATGADGEPILDLQSLKPMSAMTTRREMLRQFHSVNAELIPELSKQFGVSDVALFLLLLGQPSDNWPEQRGDLEAARQHSRT